MWQLFNLRLATNWRLDFGGDAEHNIARARRASLLPFDVEEKDGLAIYLQTFFELDRTR